MRKIYLLSVVMLAISGFAFGGGMVHNTNQSAAWIRMPVRDASVSIDAAYFNPAGLTKLKDGFHLQLNNQTILQTQKVMNFHPALDANGKEYLGDVMVPALPTFFAVYKKGKFAVSGGFLVVGGGGSASYDNGLPSFEVDIASIPGMLRASGIPTTASSSEISFTGSSIYLGGQLGVSYAINDMISVAVGGRFVSATNTYEGSIKNIMVNPMYPAAGFNGDMVAAPTFFTTMAGALTVGAAQLSTAAAGLQPAIDGGAGVLTLDQAVAMALMTQDQANQLADGFAMIDPTIDPSTLDIATIQAYYGGAAITYGDNAAAMSANAEATSDKEVDVEQKGTTFTPYFGANISLLEDKLNIGIKYEHSSKMEVENNTKVDGSGLFPDGEKSNSDIPGLFSIGASYKTCSAFTLHAGYHMYTDLSVSYGKKIDGVFVDNDKVLDANAYEIAVGGEFNASEQLLFSFGYLYTNTSPKEVYQGDLGFSLDSHSIGIGGLYKITDDLSAELGVLYTIYSESEKMVSYPAIGASYKETYNKDNTVIALGLSYRFGGASE